MISKNSKTAEGASEKTWESELAPLRSQAREIFRHALEASSVAAAFDRLFRLENGSLIRRFAADGVPRSIPLGEYKKIQVFAVGKAALVMLETLLERMPPRSAVAGICSAPSLPRQRRRGIQYFAGGHPLPNRESFRAARAALRLLARADPSTFIFFLISGGGSTLFESPLDRRISLADTIAFHQALIGSGAAIAEINTVRKHFSAVKGGRLAAAAPEAGKLTLLVSDVSAQQPDAVASGPSLPDPSTVAECREIIDRYRMLDRFPPRVRAYFANPDLPETPGRKRRDQGGHRDDTGEIFPEAVAADPNTAEMPARSRFEILLSNDDLLRAACDRARALGWQVVIDNVCDDWDYRRAAHYLLARLHRLRRQYPRVCLLSGGEVTVLLEGNPGVGGRNQQFALACALELAGNPTAAAGEAPPPPAAQAAIAILSAGSDGVDGTSPAAGAVADPMTAARARALGFDPSRSLLAFDAYPLFAALGDAVVTGPTNNNLRDLRILLSAGPPPLTLIG